MPKFLNKIWQRRRFIIDGVLFAGALLWLFGYINLNRWWYFAILYLLALFFVLRFLAFVASSDQEIKRMK